MEPIWLNLPIDAFLSGRAGEGGGGGVIGRCLFVGVWSTQDTEWLLWGGGSLASVREKASLSCRYSPLLWKEHRRLPPQQTQEPPQGAVSPECGSVLRGGLGWAGERLSSASLSGLQMEELLQVWQLLYVTVSGLILFYFFPPLLNLLLREICDYIFFSLHRC